MNKRGAPKCPLDALLAAPSITSPARQIISPKRYATSTFRNVASNPPPRSSHSHPFSFGGSSRRRRKVAVYGECFGEKVSLRGRSRVTCHLLPPFFSSSRNNLFPRKRVAGLFSLFIYSPPSLKKINNRRGLKCLDSPFLGLSERKKSLTGYGHIDNAAACSIRHIRRFTRRPKDFTSFFFPPILSGIFFLQNRCRSPDPWREKLGNYLN